MPPTTTANSANYENHESELLGKEGNQQVFKLLGSRCQSLATAVIQLYVTQPPHHQQWLKKETGALCFVKDSARKNYFFRLYCLKLNKLVWEHEMYNNMEYNENTSFLHIFEGDDYMVAFNFASTKEALHLKGLVQQKINLKKRKEEKRHRQSTEITHKAPLPTDLSGVGLRKTTDPAAKQARRRRNLTKADISQPTDFKHISHVGWNPESGFDINSQDEQLKAFFQKAGVSEKQLQDKDTREFIYNFINTYSVGNNNNNTQTDTQTPRKAVTAPVPPVPPRGSQKAPHIRAAPPPPPTNNVVETKPERPAAPLPPSKTSMQPPVPQRMESTNTTNSVPSLAPPPPPLPPVDGFSAPVAPPAPPPIDNSALMESIRSGTNLRPVEERKLTPQEDARSDLLSEIRKGCKLKPVDEREFKPVVNIPNETNSNDLAGALARALAERSKAIHSEDDDDTDSEDFNDDEWE